MVEDSKKKTLMGILTAVISAVAAGVILLFITPLHEKWFGPNRVEITNLDTLSKEMLLKPNKNDTLYVRNVDYDQKRNEDSNNRTKQLVSKTNIDINKTKLNIKDMPANPGLKDEPQKSFESNITSIKDTQTTLQPKCETNNTGNYIFDNETELELRVILHTGNIPQEYTIKSKQIKTFYDLPAGPIRYEVTNDDPPGSFRGYNDPSKPAPVRPARYFDNGSVNVIACKDQTFVIK